MSDPPKKGAWRGAGGVTDHGAPVWGARLRLQGAKRRATEPNWGPARARGAEAWLGQHRGRGRVRDVSRGAGGGGLHRPGRPPFSSFCLSFSFSLLIAFLSSFLRVPHQISAVWNFNYSAPIDRIDTPAPTSGNFCSFLSLFPISHLSSLPPCLCAFPFKDICLSAGR